MYITYMRDASPMPCPHPALKVSILYIYIYNQHLSLSIYIYICIVGSQGVDIRAASLSSARIVLPPKSTFAYE